MSKKEGIIRCCSAPCGSGKTHQTVNRVCNSTKRDSKAVIVQPTKHLIDRTVAEELKNRLVYPDHEVFHGDRVGKKQSVSGQLVEYLKVDPAPVLFMTHSLIPIVPYWHNKDAYDLLIDEEFQVVRQFHYTIPETQGLVTDMLGIEPLGPMYGRLFVQDRTLFRKRRQNEQGDQLIQTFQELLYVLSNEHYETFVNRSTAKRLPVIPL